MPGVKLPLKYNFQLEKTPSSKAFGITKKDGIIYIKDVTLLKQYDQPQFK